MTTLLITHADGLDHETPRGHPERPDRLRAVWKALADPAFDALAREDAATCDDAAILRCHTPGLLTLLRERAPSEGLAAIDADTTMSPGTLNAARLAVGGAVAAVDAVVSGRARNAFVAARPPGHHAERDRAMGFCFFNQAAIAARHAQAVHGLERIAIIDWDVHHGNGTQDIFWSDASVLYASTHEAPLYPGTGAVSEQGAHDTIVNAPLRAGDGGETFRDAFDSVVLPRVKGFKPDLIIISAGFDAHWRDPLANLNLTEQDFAWATHELMGIAGKVCAGRVVSVLEGGYDLNGLAASAAAHVRELMGA
jgi:acetoin utilization deacetylase AcuC-like enzyme